VRRGVARGPGYARRVEEQDGAILVYPDDHIDPPLSFVCVGGVHLALLATFAFCAWQWRVARRAAKLADAALRNDAVLAEGHDVIAGTVELAEGARRAVRVEVVQVGTERKGKHGWSHTWTERSRRTLAEPFYIRTPDDTRVRVEPGEAPLLVDALDRMTWTERATRTRIAQLSPGERVIAEGYLERAPDPESRRGGRGYRDSALGWVLSPPPSRPMALSTEPLGKRFRLRARAFVITSLFLGVVALGTEALLFTHTMRAAFGEDRIGVVLSKRHYTTRGSKGQIHHHYELSYSLGPGYTYSDELDLDDWSPMLSGMRIWVRVVPTFPSTRAVGRGASVGFFLWLFAAIGALVIIGWAFATHTRKRWYEGKVVNAGGGRLPEPSGEVAPDPVG